MRDGGRDAGGGPGVVRGRGRARVRSGAVVERRGGRGQLWFCLYCGEEFVDPPTEDWLQCPTCMGWFHKACGNGLDICDMCLS